MPGLMTFKATRRRTGSVCSARKTAPMPPSPRCCNSWYGPTAVPGCTAEGRSSPVSAVGSCRKLPAASWAPSRSSTRCRSAASPPQTSSRYAARAWAEGCPAAAAKIDSRRFRSVLMTRLRGLRFPSQCDVRPRRASCFFAFFGGGDFLEEPGPGERPPAVGGGPGDAQVVGRLHGRQPGEVAQLDQFRLGGVEGGQLRQGLVQGQQVVGGLPPRRPGRDFDEFRREALAAPAVLEAQL